LTGCADPRCRWATDDHTASDLAGTLRGLPWRLRWLLEDLPPDALAAVQTHVDTIAAAVGAPDASLEAIGGAAGRLRGDAAFAAVHATEHALSDAGRALVATGAIAAQTGTVAGLFVSGGGVPKSPVDEAVVGRRGVAGDRQAARQHHGRVFQALCVWSAEVVEALAEAGHPIGPGAAGENVSVRGLDWRRVRVGAPLRIGSVVAQVSAFATPCAKNARWFADRDFSRIDHDRHPGWARAYATVLGDGRIRPGDPCNVKRDSPTTTA